MRAVFSLFQVVYLAEFPIALDFNKFHFGMSTLLNHIPTLSRPSGIEFDGILR